MKNKILNIIGFLFIFGYYIIVNKESGYKTETTLDWTILIITCLVVTSITCVLLFFLDKLLYKLFGWLGGKFHGKKN